jgi:enediyne biosynthesis protein E4
MFGGDVLETSEKLVANTFETCLIENLGGMKFKMKKLPMAAQFSTVNAIVAEDLDDDGKTDLLLAGNTYPINIQLGRNDASYGIFLRGNGKGDFSPVPAVESGFRVRGEVRNLLKLKVGGEIHYVAVRNNDSVQCFATSNRGD